jgi:iron complex outermembrane recepter protein
VARRSVFLSEIEMNLRIRVAAALCAAVSVSEANVTAVPLDPVAVSGTAGNDVVNAARERLGKIPGAVSVVGREAWEDRYALTLKDTLGFVPGVYAQPRYAEEVRLSIRGSGLSRNFHLRGITLLQDGVPLTLADGSGDFQEIDPALLRLIEVYKGANALAYGASSLGGAINLVTPTARTTEPYRLSLEQGSWETRRGHAQGAWRGETLDGFASLSLSSADGWRDNSQGHSQRLAGNLGWTLGEGAETRLYLARNEIVQAVPGTLTKDAALNQPRATTPANLANQAARDIDSTRVASRTTLALGSGELALTGYAVHKRLYHPLAFGIVDQDGDFHGGSLHYRHAGGAQALTLGLQLREGDNAARVFAPLSAAGFSEQRADNRERAQHLGVYAQHEWRFAPDWTAISGAQWARDARDSENRRETERSDQRTYTGFSPRLGLLWQTTERRQLFANLSRSFEPPTFSELNQNLVGFVPLAAQKATTLELGGRGSVARHQWEWSVYRAEVEDAFIAFAVNPEQGIPAPVFNADRTVHQGVEAGLASRLWQNRQGLRLSSQLAWTWSDFRFDRDAVYGDNRLAGVPAHVLMAELRLATPARITLRPGLEWVPRGAWIDFANTARVSGYALLNLGATLELGSGFQVFVDGRNLSNRRHLSNFSTAASFTDQALFYPGEGRSVFSGLRWTGSHGGHGP